MATIVQNNRFSPIEIAKRKDPDGTHGQIAELLEQENGGFLRRVYSEQANEARSHSVPVRVKLPTVGTRQMYQGVDQSMSRVLPNIEPIMLIEDIMEVDEQAIDPEADKDMAMQGEVVAHIEAVNQAWMKQLFYGNMGNAGEIDGLSTRYYSKAQPNVQDVGHTVDGECSSIWLFESGPRKMGLVYPRNHATAGVEGIDKGHGKIRDINNKPFYGYTYQVKVMSGMNVVDRMCVHRVGGIATTGSTNNMQDPSKKVHHNIIDAMTFLPKGGIGGTAFMGVNRWLLAQFNKWALDKQNGFDTIVDITGQRVTMFQDMPIVLIEALSGTEDTISA